MVSNQTLSNAAGWLRVGIIACAALAAACTSTDKNSRAAVPAGESVAQSPVLNPADEDLSATEAATIVSSAPSGGRQLTAQVIRDDAPARYTVKRGDTLWGISSLFLKDPWLWPEIWYVNPQVANPHLIFPGDVLALAYGGDGTPRIILESSGDARLNPRLRSTPLDGPIATIPYSAIAAFLSRPTLLSLDEVRDAPHVLAFSKEHMVGGSGQEIYVRRLDAPLNARYAIVHPSEKLHDPDTGDILGYQGVYTATALVTRPGDPLKASLTDAARETLQGDILIQNDAEVPLTFEVRVPTADVNGQIISTVDGTSLIGPYQIVAINRGTRHGLAPGHVLAIDQAGAVVRDAGNRTGVRRWWSSGLAFQERVQLPEERIGTALVFKTYDRMSYAIIVGANDAIRIADVVRTP